MGWGQLDKGGGEGAGEGKGGGGVSKQLLSFLINEQTGSSGFRVFFPFHKQKQKYY